MLLDRLDRITLKAFELSHGSTEIPTCLDVRNFVMKQCTALESIGVSSKKSNKFSSSPKVADSRTWVKTKKPFFTSTDQSRRKDAHVATSGFLNSTPAIESNEQFAPLLTDVNNCQPVAFPPREDSAKHSDAGMHQDSPQPGCFNCRKTILFVIALHSIQNQLNRVIT
ncbi:hypothetical protein HHI36_001324 [Cryptolaemus montrouzieri]|uniref:Uncharacterized protein n=1 Tax=Cryptolaemus montrouzieri TaxID=559131 RepID=A0ABD2P7A7_9CUCU